MERLVRALAMFSIERLQLGIRCPLQDKFDAICFQWYASISMSRYFVQRSNRVIPRQPKWTENLQLPEEAFKVKFRMSRSNFDLLVQRLRSAPQFKAPFKKTKPQMPIEVQLMAFLSRVGFSGNAAGIHMISLDLEIGRGTVQQYYIRCLEAIHSWRDEVIMWPGIPERREIAERIAVQSKDKFQSCVGYIDGTLFNFGKLLK
jgi:hypothetical protein